MKSADEHIEASAQLRLAAWHEAEARRLRAIAGVAVALAEPTVSRVEETISVGQAAVRARVTKPTVRLWVHENRFKAVRPAGQWRIVVSSFDAFLAGRR